MSYTTREQIARKAPYSSSRVLVNIIDIAKLPQETKRNYLAVLKESILSEEPFDSIALTNKLEKILGVQQNAA